MKIGKLYNVAVDGSTLEETVSSTICVASDTNGVSLQFNAGVFDEDECFVRAAFTLCPSETGADGFAQSIDLITRQVNALNSARVADLVQHEPELADKLHELAVAVDVLRSKAIRSSLVVGRFPVKAAAK